MTTCRSCACGCCAGIERETPLLIANRPALSAIAYRVGTHASWKKSMLAALSGVGNPLSGKLTTRDDDDFSIALLDSWAIVSDVLTFYQERIANESYLRTAVERLSLTELSRLIGYEPAPAVAAETMLAFTIDGEATKENVIIETGTRVQSVPGQNEKPQTFETSEELIARAEWNELSARPTTPKAITSTETWLAGTETNLKVGSALLFTSGATFNLRLLTSVKPDFDNDKTHVTWQPALTFTPTTVYAMRVAAPMFAHNAPQPGVFTFAVRNRLDPGILSSASEWRYLMFALTVEVDGAHPEIKPGGILILTRPGGVPRRYDVTSATEISKSKYAVSGKETLVGVNTSNNLGEFSGSAYRGTLVYAGNEELGLAEWPRTSGISGQTIELTAKIKPFTGERKVLISGPKTTGAVSTEEAVVVGVSGTAFSTLQLKAPITGYDPKKLRIFGNVVAASHGETVKQVLGSGDATKAFQRFPLGRAPLTFISSPDNPRGAKSTLSVHINDILWKEVPTLFATSPRDRIYRLTRDAEEKSAVQFGDGRDQGPRLPTGQDNVRATYRVGAGKSGNVRAGQLTLLLTQPFGVKEVKNPVPAEGGVEAELFKDVRRNAPRTVLTIDRVVSLRDYESFAASFQGIGKALATWTWLGTSRQVFLSVAGANGEAIGPNHPIRKDLLGALNKFGRPFVPVRIESFAPVFFRITARFRVDPDYINDVVMADVRKALEKAFAFEARTFSQAVSLSEVMSVIQGVKGVVFVDVDKLYRRNAAQILNPRLAAARPKILPNGTVQAAEILMLDEWSTLDVQPMVSA